jgi:hypothetical protein
MMASNYIKSHVQDMAVVLSEKSRRHATNQRQNVLQLKANCHAREARLVIFNELVNGNGGGHGSVGGNITGI